MNTILEVGAGHGINTHILATNFPAKSFTVIDLNKPKASFRNNVTVEVGDYNDWQSKYKYDLIFAIETLCHSKNQPHLYKVLRGNLRVGGLLVVFDGYQTDSIVSNSPQAEAATVAANAMAVHRFMTHDEIVKSAKNAGLVHRKSENISSDILPSLRKIEYEGRVFFANRTFAKVCQSLLGTEIVQNAIAGYLLRPLVSDGYAEYWMDVYQKS